MNVETGAVAALFPEKEYINGIAFTVCSCVTIVIVQEYLEEGGVAVSDSALRARLAEELHSLRGKSRGARGTRKGSALFTFLHSDGHFCPM
jgi:hypothetical protein